MNGEVGVRLGLNEAPSFNASQAVEQGRLVGDEETVGSCPNAEALPARTTGAVCALGPSTGPQRRGKGAAPSRAPSTFTVSRVSTIRRPGTWPPASEWSSHRASKPPWALEWPMLHATGAARRILPLFPVGPGRARSWPTGRLKPSPTGPGKPQEAPPILCRREPSASVTRTPLSCQ